MFKNILKNGLIHTKNYHQSSILRAASIFNMPAMSPTMTEGGITSWKIKNGESFKAGDVLLEVETDKATIDVEAQDDGILWEILVKEGETGVEVGKPIAFLAEPDDDLSSLEKPSIEQTKPEAEKEQTTTESKPEPSTPSNETSNKPIKEGIFNKPNVNQKLLPSVELLLHENNISIDEAFNKIEATGPNGRLLKGDILSYLGKISQSSLATITEFIKSKQHLDLSNIVIVDPSELKPKEQDQKKEQVKEVEKPKNIIAIKLSSEFGNVSKNQFKYSMESIIHSSIVKTYGAKFPQYASSPSINSNILNDIFDDLLVPSPTINRFTIYDIIYKFHDSKEFLSPINEFDDILGVSPSIIPPSTTVEGTVDVEFKIKFNEKLIDSKQFVESFQQNLLSQVPTKNMIILN